MDSPAQRLSPWEIVKLACWLGKATAIVGLVIWHLVFLLVRNPVDSNPTWIPAWSEPWDAARPPWQRLDQATTAYGNGLRIEQGWTMFAAPLAREADFLEVRLVFADGERLTLPSENAVDPAGFYCRRGGFRQRKLEDYLLGHLDCPLLDIQIRARVHAWRRAHPGDGRVPERVELVCRRYVLPNPHADSRSGSGPVDECLAAFDMDGQRLSEIRDP